MIPYFDYRPEYRALRPEIDAAIRGVLESGRLILGPEVEAFEREFAAYTGAAHAVGVASGTDAICLALRALGIGEGDEVLTVANAGVPPVAAIRSAGARPAFVDVDRETLLLDPAAAEAALTPRVRAMLVVHLYGRPAPMEPLLEIARRHDLALVEDCSHAHGAERCGRQAGTTGAVGCFSFYPTKVVGAYGDGGLCVTSDPDLAHRIRQLRTYGLDETGRAGIEGVNSRLDEIQAAVLRVKLRHLDETLATRRRLAARYLDRLDDSAYRLDRAPPDTRHAYHLFVVRCEDRPKVVRALEAAAVGHGFHYRQPAHTMEAYRFLGFDRGRLPETERACDAVLSLPLFPGLEVADLDRVAAVLLDAS